MVDPPRGVGCGPYALPCAEPHHFTLTPRTDTLTIARGEVVGLVGESGSGKSMTARSVTRRTPPEPVSADPPTSTASPSST
ncbi:ATP-binding cassette domain-containing protein [Streptomyces sp. NPDC058092]|uniref:ATP-binding cassette domain-containing protein n=1 Tax=Streptomyces sp. NPDC058092 TaxID=3346336 RepID=UPI0036E5C2F5